MSLYLRQSDDFLDQLVIRHGPEDLLARFFFKAVHEVAARGVSLEFGTFAQLLETNQKNSDSWFPITTSFREYPGGAREDSGFVILGRDQSGEIVATQAERLYDWTGSTFKIEAESLRLFYADPDVQKAATESCSVTARAADKITGRVAYSGGVWYRPDYRRLQLTEILPRIGRAYAFALWNFDYLAALITPQNIRKAFDRRAGYREIEPESVIMRNSPSLPDGDLHMALGYQTPHHLIDDTFGFLMDFGSQIDVAVGQRRAQ